MATRQQVLLIDDLDGSEAEGTVRFALDGNDYEIDLNPKNARALRKLLSRYAERARKASSRPARGGRRRKPDTAEVREWAKAQGIDVKDHGRVPAELVVKFKAATSN